MDTLYALLTAHFLFKCSICGSVISENVLKNLCNYSLASVDEVEMHI